MQPTAIARDVKKDAIDRLRDALNLPVLSKV